MTPDNLDTKLDDAMIEIVGRPVDADLLPRFLRDPVGRILRVMPDRPIIIEETIL